MGFQHQTLVKEEGPGASVRMATAWSFLLVHKQESLPVNVPCEFIVKNPS